MMVARREPPPSPQGGNVYFVADAHLGSESAAAERSKVDDLCGLLRCLRPRAASLYLVGDLFDFWFEFRMTAPSDHPEVIQALSDLSRAGTEIHFLGGNHDYWVGERLETMTGAQVHRRPVVVTHFGRKLFIAHGDGLPSGDWGYRLLKAIIRSGPAIAAFRVLHPTIGSAIARWASGLSEITEDRILNAIPPMKKFLEETVATGHDAAVVGHVHRPLTWEWENGTGVIVGDWMANRSVVELSKEGFRMLRWSEGALVQTEREPDGHGEREHPPRDP